MVAEISAQLAHVQHHTPVHTFELIEEEIELDEYEDEQMETIEEEWEGKEDRMEIDHSPSTRLSTGAAAAGGALTGGSTGPHLSMAPSSTYLASSVSPMINNMPSSLHPSMSSTLLSPSIQLTPAREEFDEARLQAMDQALLRPTCKSCSIPRYACS